ncbi:MAG: hypothetical protein HYY49_13465 [Ignavibacteriales bacterium]|nr:hypothetical protein [Ignavibacteriales bacterium]
MPTFLWLRNLSDFLVGSLRSARHFDAENYMGQLAEHGFTHVTINGLGVDRPFESGPSGDVYSWFYDYSPDLDQFVDSTLLKGFYPAGYLKANLEFLKRNAALSLKNGLIPGLHVNSPRSMPELFWLKYPYLRGARVDHPRESFLPRYTLAMAHPVVQQHYRELVQKIMAEVPQIGFIHVWTNDSGAGFEFTSSLYAGRNGGPYLIREWKNDEEIERKASENVLTYYRLLRDEARAVNPAFRLVGDLGPFYKERPYIIRGLGDGMDAGSFAYFEGPHYSNEQRELRKAGAWTHEKIDVGDNNVLGVPCPRVTYERFMKAVKRGDGCVLANLTPRSHAPYDINGEVVRSVQQKLHLSLGEITQAAAARWVDAKYVKELISIWDLSDRAVRSYPPNIPYSTYGFPWFRLWVRPFVPNIDAIPEHERSYYEKYLLATFNNPTRVDLNNDMMWNFLTVKQAEQKRNMIDTKVIPPLDNGIERIQTILSGDGIDENTKKVFKDLDIRLRAARCYYTTMRNVVAWIESVHGYLQAATKKQKDAYRKKVGEMIQSESQNAKNLLHLWETSPVDVIPISRSGESLHIYGENFGELLKKKIELMDRHKDDEPYIDPNYMWRLPVDSAT